MRGPRASQCRFYPKTSNPVNLVLYAINLICSVRSPCLATVYYIKRRRIPLILVLYAINLICSARSPCLATVYYIKRRRIPLILVLYAINLICSVRSPCLATVYYIKRRRIPLIWYYIWCVLFYVRRTKNTIDKKTGLFSFRLFVHFIRKVAIRRSLGQRKVLNRKSKYSEN